MNSEKYGIVTGASRGLGKQMAIELAREGYDVIFTYNSNVSLAEGVKKDLSERFGVRVEIFPLQVESAKGVQELYQFAVSTFGENLHVLINNAGIYQNVNLDDMDPKDFDAVIDTNLKGTFYM